MTLMTRLLQGAWRPVGRLLPERIRTRLSSDGLRTLNRMNRRLKSTNLYKKILLRRTDELARNTLIRGALLTDDPGYLGYVRAQIEKSYRLATSGLSGPFLMDRTVELVDEMRVHLPGDRDAGEVLCVGCRNSAELDYIEESCGLKAVGLDLFSLDPRIVVGDMHKIPFVADRFDVLYSCHSLEHSYDIGLAINEFARVLKDGGLLVVEVPVNIKTSEVDRWDLGSASGLLAYLGTGFETRFRQDRGQDSRLIGIVRKTACSPPEISTEGVR